MLSLGHMGNWAIGHYLEVKVEDVLDVDSTTSVVWPIRETSLLTHEVCAKALFLSAVSLNARSLRVSNQMSLYLSERNVEFWKPTFCPPAILYVMKN